jgi:small multidrug resistance family-3 protein
MIRTGVLFLFMATAEILGCYLADLVLRQQRPTWQLIPAALCLAVYAWLLTLHPTAAGRVYASYGAMDVAIAFVWLRLVDGVPIKPVISPVAP